MFPSYRKLESRGGTKAFQNKLSLHPLKGYKLSLITILIQAYYKIAQLRLS